MPVLGSISSQKSVAYTLRQRATRRTVEFCSRSMVARQHIRCSYTSAELDDKTPQQVDFRSRAKPLLLEMKESFAAGALAPFWVEVDPEARSRLNRASSKLAALAVYGDEDKTFTEDMQFYQQGTDLFVRDFKRDFPRLRAELLGKLNGEQPSFSPLEQARIRRLRGDLIALVPFAFISMNTVPLTPAIMPTKADYFPSLNSKLLEMISARDLLL